MCGHNSICNNDVLNDSASIDLKLKLLPIIDIDVLFTSDDLFVGDEKMKKILPLKTNGQT